MPIYKTKNENFFKKWSPEMAYILGFFAADGSMIKNKRGAHFIEFQITDKELLEEIKKLLGSNHKISILNKNTKWKTAYRLQIGSKKIFNDLLLLGITKNKSKKIKLPKIPEKYLCHFVRGYFDGDGNVTFGYFKKSDRTKKSPAIITRFTSGSKDILEELKLTLTNSLDTKGSLFFSKNNAWQLSYSANDSQKLFKFMYIGRNNNKNIIYLERKYKIFLKAGCDL